MLEFKSGFAVRISIFLRARKIVARINTLKVSQDYDIKDESAFII